MATERPTRISDCETPEQKSGETLFEALFWVPVRAENERMVRLREEMLDELW